jgi:hypothetical protein
MSFRACATLTATIFAAGALLFLPTGCLNCTLAACASGFSWEVEAEDGSPLADGEYQLSVTLDGATYEVTCTVVNPEDGASACSQVSSPEGGSFELDVYVTRDSEGPRAHQRRPHLAADHAVPRGSVRPGDLAHRRARRARA